MPTRWSALYHVRTNTARVSTCSKPSAHTNTDAIVCNFSRFNCWTFAPASSGHMHGAKYYLLGCGHSCVSQDAASCEASRNACLGNVFDASRELCIVLTCISCCALPHVF